MPERSHAILGAPEGFYIMEQWRNRAYRDRNDSSRAGQLRDTHTAMDDIIMLADTVERDGKRRKWEHKMLR